MTRGDVFFADIDTIGRHVQAGYRPWLVVQNDVGNYYSPTTIVVPLTSNLRKHPNQPTHTIIKHPPLHVSLALCEQVRVVDIKSWWRPVCKLSDGEMERVDTCLKNALGVGF